MKKRRDARKTRRVLLLPTVLAFAPRCPLCGAILRMANLDKAVDAAQGQIEAIYRLEERGMLEELPDKLKEAVDLRVAHPELTLAQLAELCEPPVSKSAFNHRLRKLMEMARA